MKIVRGVGCDGVGIDVYRSRSIECMRQWRSVMWRQRGDFFIFITEGNMDSILAWLNAGDMYVLSVVADRSLYSYATSVVLSMRSVEGCVTLGWIGKVFYFLRPNINPL